MDSLSAWLLHHYGKEQFVPGLERVSAALKDVLPAFKKTKIITIAGTNGKGETTLRLSALLNQKRHCVWTSPHITRVTERFRSEEGEIPLPDLEALIKKCHAEVESQKFKLTYYEFLFYVFCVWSAERTPDYLLLEVGLGGRLDAVNVFDAQMVLLPSLSRDHQEFLGHRYDLILKEKLGVLRPQALLMSFLDLTYLRERAHETTKLMGASFFDLAEVSPLKSFQFSQRNQFLAYAAYCQLMGAPREEKWSPQNIPLEHRGEEVRQGALWTLFGSHNSDGLRKLIQFLHSENYNLPRQSFDDVVIAFSQRALDDLSVMLKMIKASGLGSVKVTSFNHPKAASKEVMEGLARQEGLQFVKDLDSYVHEKSSGKVLVTGSYYFLGHVKSLLGR